MRRGAFARAVRAEWTKLRSVRTTTWLLLGGLAATVAFGLLVCSAVSTSGGGPVCTPGEPGCGDDDVVLNSLGGAYLGQIAFVALGIWAITAELATGTIRATFLAVPRRPRVLLAKLGVVGAIAFAVGLVAAVASFVLGQPILHGNGFTPANGYPIVALTEPPVLRALVGTALYLAAVTVFAVGVGAIVRRSGAAIAIVLGLLYVPMIVSLLLPESIRGTVQVIGPMMAGLSVQATVARADSVPIGPWAGLGVAWAWAVAAAILAAWIVRRRDA